MPNRRVLRHISLSRLPQSAPVIALLACTLLASALPRVQPSEAATGTRPERPAIPTQIGQPHALSAYWHDQRWVAGDFYACALYAQASVLEALGYEFATELARAREQGERDGWYDPEAGTLGLGQPLRAHGIRYSAHGTSLAGFIPRERALIRLQTALEAGLYVIANLDAQQIAHYRGSAIRYHTIWITGMRFHADGQARAVVANDSYHGPAVEYDIDEFLDAWGTPEFNYYAIFIEPGAASDD